MCVCMYVSTCDTAHHQQNFQGQNSDWDISSLALSRYYTFLPFFVNRYSFIFIVIIYTYNIYAYLKKKTTKNEERREKNQRDLLHIIIRYNLKDMYKRL